MPGRVTASIRCPHCGWSARSSRDTVVDVVIDLEQRARDHVTEDHQRPAPQAVSFNLERTEIRMKLDDDPRLERNAEARGERVMALAESVMHKMSAIGVPFGDTYRAARGAVFDALADDLYGNAPIDIPTRF